MSNQSSQTNNAGHRLGEMFFKVEQNQATGQIRIVVEGFAFDGPNGAEAASALLQVYRDVTMQIIKECNPEAECIKDDGERSVESLLQEFLGQGAGPAKKRYIN